MQYEYDFDDIHMMYAYDEHPDDKDFTMHIHDRCEIYFLVSGDVEYLVEGSKYPLKKNSIMIMRPAEVHKARILKSKRYERFAVNFPLSFIDNLDKEKSLTKAFTDRPLGEHNMIDGDLLNADLIKDYFTKMSNPNSSDYERQLTINIYLPVILDMIRHAYDNVESRTLGTASNAQRMVTYVNNHLFENLSVPELAEHFFLSASQFGRVFKQATGASPWEYITKKRLTVAREKIKNGATAQNASESCGFGDYSAFYRAYIKHFGIAPTSHLR